MIYNPAPKNAARSRSKCTCCYHLLLSPTPRVLRRSSMSKRLTLLALISLLILSLASCSSEPAPTEQKAAAPAAAAPKKEEPPPVIYELTKDPILEHADWTSRNISIHGAK